MAKRLWANFYYPDGRPLLGLTVKGVCSGELHAAKDLLAAEQGIVLNRVMVRLEKKPPMRMAKGGAQ